MLREVFGERFMALEAGGVAIHGFRQLICRRTFVHRMAGRTRHLAVYETRRFYQAVVFAAGNTNHPIAPKCAPAAFRGLLAADDVQLRLQVLAGVETLATLEPFLFIAGRMNAMAAAAHLGGAFGGKAGRVCYSGIALSLEVQGVTAQRV